MEPKKLVIVDGILCLALESLREILDVKVFLVVAAFLL